MKLYLAGPMSGIIDNNYPRFHHCAAVLRKLHYHVLNPAENKPPADPTWQNWMRISVIQLAQADVVVMIEGWQDSKGALIGKRLADDLGIPVRAYEGDLGANVNSRMLGRGGLGRFLQPDFISPQLREGWTPKK